MAYLQRHQYKKHLPTATNLKVIQNKEIQSHSITPILGVFVLAPNRAENTFQSNVGNVLFG